MEGQAVKYPFLVLPSSTGIRARRLSRIRIFPKGCFDRRLRIDKTQNSRLKITNENLQDTIEANVSSTFVKFTSGSFEWT